MKKFKKGVVINTQRRNYKCICVDNEVAIFAPINRALNKVKFKDMFAVDSSIKKAEKFNFKFKFVK